MLTTIRGVYEEGKIILSEEPPVKSKAEVMVTFLDDSEKRFESKGKQKIILGLLEGKIDTPDNFDDSLDDLKDYI